MCISSLHPKMEPDPATETLQFLIAWNIKNI